MTEINGKKYYTWDEVRAMPLGIKFRLSNWLPHEWICFERTEKGFIDIRTDGLQYEMSEGKQIYLTLQDRFELVEDKPVRKYFTGFQAFEKFINGEWKKIACDDPNFEIEYFHEFSDLASGEVKISSRFKDKVIHNALEKYTTFYFLSLKKWYEYKEQQ